METQAYRIRRPYYRAGKYYRAGSVVRIPAGEKPSKFWTKVDEAEAKAKPFVAMEPEPIRQEDAPKAPKAPKGVRASDKDI